MCTTLLIKTASTKEAGKPGDVVSGRTMEFGFDLHSQVMVIPKGTEMTGTIPSDTGPDGSKISSATKPGIKYTTKYDMIGANGLGMPVIVDGINEHGLYFSALYFPGYAVYANVPEGKDKDALAPHELGNWVLGTCESVSDVRNNIGKIVLANTVVDALGVAPPLHFIVRDTTGESLVIEPLKGGMTVYENPVGVMTNSPPFDWHLLNLINYRALRTENVGSVVLGGGHELPLFGQGSGMFGLPGDATPPSRFVRAVAYSQTAMPTVTTKEAVLQVFHIMNCFDIPLGSITDTHVPEQGETQVHRDYTSWTIVADLTNRRLYFRTYNDQSIRMVDLRDAIKAANIVGRRTQFIEMDSKQPIVDTSTRFMVPA